MTRSLAAVLLVALAPRLALAAPPPPSVARCLDASEEGQRLRDEGKLSRARALFETCSSATCPAVVRSNCTMWLEGVVQSVPSIVVSARDDNGADVLDASVEIDGVTRGPVGWRPIDLDPGPHTVKVTAPHHRSNEQRLIAVAGEKSRPVRAVLDRITGDLREVPSAAAPSTGAEQPGQGRGIPAFSLVFGGIGVVSAGVSLGLGLTARSDISALEGSSCAATKSCAQDDVDSIRARLLVADILLGVAVVSIVAAGVYWVFSGPAARK